MALKTIIKKGENTGKVANEIMQLETVINKTY